MSIKTSTSPKVIPIRRMLLTGLIIILGFAITAGYVWIQTDHVIAPPVLRLIEGIWRLFIYRHPLLGGPVHLM